MMRRTQILLALLFDCQLCHAQIFSSNFTPAQIVSCPASWSFYNEIKAGNPSVRRLCQPSLTLTSFDLAFSRPISVLLLTLVVICPWVLHVKGWSCLPSLLGGINWELRYLFRLACEEIKKNAFILCHQDTIALSFLTIKEHFLWDK